MMLRLMRPCWISPGDGSFGNRALSCVKGVRFSVKESWSLLRVHLLMSDANEDSVAVLNERLTNSLVGRDP